ncbi:MAG TPA: hypothetical protein VKB96_17730, partial [Gammaproteobacteria bacterium]|nr:hypothetical protein [Gammaproteobacteria bacterium]
MRRFFKYTLLTLVLLVAVLIVAFAYIIATESGTHFAWTIARGILPEGLKIATIEGRLLGPLTVRGVDYRAKNFHLSVGEGQLRWAPRDLIITRTLNVDVVAVDNVRYTQLGSAPSEPKKKSEPLSLPRRINLPLNVRLGEFRLQDVKYRSAPDVKPVVLRQAILSASLIKDRLTVARLAIDAPLLSLDGNARMTASNDFALQGAFNWQARLPHFPTVKGHTRLDGGLLRTLRIQQTVRAPYNTNAQVVVADPLKQARFNAVLNVKALVLRTIDPKLPPTTLNLALKAAGVPNDLVLHAKATAKSVQYGALVLAFDGGFADQVATIEKLAVSSPEQPARLNAHGRVALKGKQPKFDVKARWQQLRWPLSGNPQFASRNGRLDIDGSMNAARARLAAAVNGTALVQAGVKGEETLKTQFSGGFAKQTKLIKIDNLDVAFAKQRLSTQ